MPASHRVILDTDIGTDVDDLMALALILGTPAIELLGVTTVYGDVDLRARMTKRVAAIAGADFPVYAGEPETLSGREVWWAGHEGALYEDLGRERIGGADGVQFLIDSVCAEPGAIDVIAIGPLTNIAAAITRDDRFAASIRHLWIMGGSFADDEPEHNLRSDAAAAAIVFGAGIPSTVAGLEATRLISMGSDALDRIGGAAAIGKTIEAEIRQWWAFWETEWNVPHDPVTVLSMVRPELFTYSAEGTVTIAASGPDEGVSRFRAGAGRTRIIAGLDAQAVAEAIVAGIESAADPARSGDPG